MLVFCNLFAQKITPLVSRLNFTNMILVLYAHPYPQHSRACKALLRGWAYGKGGDALRDKAVCGSRLPVATRIRIRRTACMVSLSKMLSR